ncbi:MAG TPA: hypothetical protein VNW97_07290 [Candidatus Saccharimonadales bacterium]|jgi:hypothetical protein|nr:hypothetical protein [Candidatus Saccharimonadales bacterium]
MKIARPVWGLIAALVLLPVAYSQQVQQQEQLQKNGPPPAVKPATKIAKEDRQFALQMLEVADSTARGFEPPMRTWGMLQLGQTFNSSDPAKAKALFIDAFTASLSIADDDRTKETLQDEIFRGLLPLSQADVEERLAQAESPVRKRTSEAIVRRYVEKKQYGPAMDLITQVTGWDEFPYASGTSLLMAMPAEMQAEKMTLLTQAVASYKAHDHPGVQVGQGTMTQMMVRFGAKMPPKLALEAIDELLSQAKKSEEKASVVLSGQGGTAAFNSIYEYQLFALLPLLRNLDEGRAENLLKENASLNASLEKLPNGMQSLDPNMTDVPLKDGQNGGIGSSVTTGNSAASSVSANYLLEESRRKAFQIIADSNKNPLQAIAQAQGLPMTVADQRSSPRAQALEGIARENLKTSPGAARQAVDELRKTVVDLPLRAQVQFLASSADLYLQLGEKESAGKVVEEGFKLSAKILDHDLNPDDPNKALKAWWPSADAYRRFIDVETKLSHRGAVEILKEIKDPEVRMVESIMLSRALLGLAMKSVRTEENTKSGKSISVFDSN